jgi:hypothetical protein
MMYEVVCQRMCMMVYETVHGMAKKMMTYKTRGAVGMS